MAAYKIVFFGAEKSGKTKLSARFKYDHYNEDYILTIGSLFTVLSREPDRLDIWEIGGADRFRSLMGMYCKEANVGVLCIDLSQQSIDENDIKQRIEEFRQHTTPDTKLILVGTKADLDKKAQARLDAINIEGDADARIITSAKDNAGIEELVNTLFQLSKLEAQVITAPKEIITIEQAKQNLLQTLEALPAEKKLAIEQQITDLEESLQSPESDKAEVIQDFTNNCHEILEGKHPNIIRAVLTLAAVAVVTAIAALVGFGIGFAAGAWTGPGAFISGFMAGSAAAVSVVAASGSLGLLAGVGCAFFNKTSKVDASVISAVDEFAKAEMAV